MYKRKLTILSIDNKSDPFSKRKSESRRASRSARKRRPSCIASGVNGPSDPLSSIQTVTINYWYTKSPKSQYLKKTCSHGLSETQESQPVCLGKACRSSMSCASSTVRSLHAANGTLRIAQRPRPDNRRGLVVKYSPSKRL